MLLSGGWVRWCARLLCGHERLLVVRVPGVGSTAGPFLCLKVFSHVLDFGASDYVHYFQNQRGGADGTDPPTEERAGPQPSQASRDGRYGPGYAEPTRTGHGQPEPKNTRAGRRRARRRGSRLLPKSTAPLVA